MTSAEEHTFCSASRGLQEHRGGSEDGVGFGSQELLLDLPRIGWPMPTVKVVDLR